MAFGEINIAKTMVETDKKCPSCGAVMGFDPSTGGLKCSYCGHTEEISAEDSAKERDFMSEEEKGNHDWGVATKTVICKSCGAETVYDELQIASECPYCGSNQVMEVKEADTLAPEGVCPFRIDIKNAGTKFKKWISRKLFCPREAKKKARPEAFKGVYLPYWTFDSDTKTSYRANYGIDRVVSDFKGKSRIVTDWHSTSGTYSEFIDDQTVLASVRHGENLLSGVEPFVTKENVIYSPKYIAGFASERYSVGLKDAWEKAKILISRRLDNSITREIRARHNADRVSNLSLSTIYTNIKYKYLLLPVWLSSFKYRGKLYQFAINGQTGRVSGKTPISPLRVAVAIFIFIAILAFIYVSMQYM
ncbi:MAG: hypothetical protein VB120_02920 [Lachnospiraceae bacterium]|nr:hypothetical protein [Lachnospiraceae bacterium]